MSFRRAQGRSVNRNTYLDNRLTTFTNPHIYHGDLHVERNQTIGGNLFLSGNIDVLGSANFNTIPTSINPSLDNSSNQLATTAFVKTNLGDLVGGAGAVHLTGNETITGIKTFNADVSMNTNLRVGGTIYGNISGTVSSDQIIKANSNVASTSTDTGSLIVKGGVGISGNAFVGGNSTILGNVVVNSTTVSISTSTGALQITGGAGIGGNMFVGGSLSVTGTTSFTGVPTAPTAAAGTITTQLATTAFVNTAITTSDTNVVHLSGTETITGSKTFTTDVSMNSALRVGSGSASTSTSTGALQITGGAGIGGNLFVGGNSNVTGSITTGLHVINSTVVSTSTSTGALQVSGGAGIGGNLFVGGNLQVSNAVGIGKAVSTTYELDVSGQIRIFEAVGSNIINKNSIGSLALEHADGSGCSSIMFKGPNAGTTGDYAYIKYQDNESSSLNSGNRGLLTIGIENDATTSITNDSISLYADGGLGYVGVNTKAPTAALDVVGDFKVSGVSSLRDVGVSDGIISCGWGRCGQALSGSLALQNAGSSVALSSTGTVVAVGSKNYNSSQGRVQVYNLVGSVWSQLGADLSGTPASTEQCGFSVALSSNGTTVIIGSAFYNSGVANGGRARIYNYNGSIWTKLGADIIGTIVNENCGYSVDISTDGTIVAVGSAYNGTSNTGRVRVYLYSGSTWNQLGADLVTTGSQTIALCKLSSNGQIVATSSPGGTKIYSYNSSSWTQLGNTLTGAQGLSLSSSGTIVAIGNITTATVTVYMLITSTWTPMGSTINGDGGEQFGYSISLSSTGTILVIGAFQYANYAGRVKVYYWNGSLWGQRGVDLIGNNPGDAAGISCAVSSDGTRIAIGSSGFSGFTGRVQVYYGAYGTLDVSGSLNFNGDSTVSGNIISISQTASTSTSTGALQITGGAGIGGNLCVGGNYFLNSFVLIPAGTIIMSASIAEPGGWLDCDGRLFNINVYPDLFSAISYSFGGSDQSFNLPDMRGRAGIGLGQGSALTNRTLGATGGAETHTLTHGEMPSHRHGVTDPGHSHSYVNNTGNQDTDNALGTQTAADDADYSATTGSSFTGISIDLSGGGLAHNNMQPFVVLRYLIKF